MEYRNIEPTVSKELQKFNPVAVIGAGTIGISWIALFLAYGLEVRVNDPREDIENIILSSLQNIAPSLELLNRPIKNLTKNLIIEKDLSKAVRDVKVVQENGPENAEFKQNLYMQLENLTSKDALLLSSSSGITPSIISKKMKNSTNLLIGHPFNPPHMIPLVEIVKGEDTTLENLNKAIEFYTLLGKKPVLLNKEISGFVANRLQSALLRESLNLILEGVVSAKELDDIVTSSIGLRWAADGPLKSFHLGGGKFGIDGFLKHLGPSLNSSWDRLGTPKLNDETISILSNSINNDYGNFSLENLESLRDVKQISIINALNSK